VNEKHSWDKIFMQLNIVLGWFNPCFWLIKSELEMIHEFTADNKAIANADAADFASMLLFATFPKHQYKLSNPFFFSPIKRRLIMLTQNKNPRLSYLRRLIILPLLAIVILVFSFRKKETNVQLKTEKKYKVVIDAGHGGQDIGVTGIDGKTYEKDIALAISKAIKQNNINEKIEIILTRDDDHFDHVKVKADFSNNQKADLFVSIHCNDGPVHKEENEFSGTEIYVMSSEKNNGFMDASKILAQSVNTHLKQHFANNGIKQRTVGIWVLQATNCPSILIETGMLTNKRDLEILKNSEQQNLMAKDILKGIENYLASKENKNEFLKLEIINIDSTKATAAEIEEYDKICEKYQVKKSKYRYDFSKISEVDNNKMVEIFFKMSKTQQELQEVYLRKAPSPSPKSIPSTKQLHDWATEKKYGIWIDDGRQIVNSQLLKYSATDFSNFSISRLEKNAINYGKHYYQLNLMTNSYYDNHLFEYFMDL
jgi:N-acetylmuramoyl-L-alanine amidase